MPSIIKKTFDSRMKLVLDSVSPEGIRLPTIQWRHPRMIHADFMTHRVFSRLGRSSRAVPVLTLMEEAKTPYIPHFMANQTGMVANEEMDPYDRVVAEGIWSSMAHHCWQGVEKLQKLGVHKQWANRPLEWFGYIEVGMSTTDIANFFELREDGSAQPEIRQIAMEMHELLDQSEPRLLKPGQWHLPYIEEADWDNAADYICFDLNHGTNPPDDMVLDLLKKISAARCARLSIKPYDGNSTYSAELRRYLNLVVSKPVHASPVEHQATPDTKSFYAVHKGGPKGWSLAREGLDWDNPELHGNFRGWIQNRKTIPGEAVFDVRYIYAHARGD